MGKEKKLTSITVRITDDLKKRVYAAMERERRSLTNFVVCALEDRVEKKVEA